jgi:Protein of unknown function (DUF1566)
MATKTEMERGVPMSKHWSVRRLAAGMVGLGLVLGVSAEAGTVLGDPLPGRYTVAADTVKDNRTGLIWQRVPWPTTVEVTTAGATCQTLALAGLPKGSWFAPAKKQLESLVVGTAAHGTGGTLDTSPASDGKETFPSATAADQYCTGTQGKQDPLIWWGVNFALGDSVYAYQGDKCRLRCVREGP